MAKGRRTGGREKGTPNKTTRDRIAIVAASERATQAKKLGRKQATEVLDDLMHTAMSMAVKYQPPAPGMESPDEAKFMEWLQVAGVFAKALAGFQTPKLKAVMVNLAPTLPEQKPATIDQQGNVLDMDDPKQLARVYASMVRRVG
jgi:hypothetical protein